MKPTESTRTLLREIFEPGGVLDRHLDEYEFRPSQLEMAGEVLDAIQQSHHLCVEAGTGTGKTLAYLIPALFSTRRVIISTATRNLQEQLFNRDIPFLRRHVKPDLKASCMKGRSNYLCLQKLEDLGSDLLPFADGRTEGVQRLKEWAEQTTTGDRSELDWLGSETELWDSLDARSDRCSGQKCHLFKDCFITRMRQRALESDIIVVNHALFFANLALETDEIGKVLPDFAVLVLDEAHAVEDVASNFLGRRISSAQLDDWGRDCRILLGAAAPQTQLDQLQRRAARFFAALPADARRTSLNFHRCTDGSTIDLRAGLEPAARELIDALILLGHQLATFRLEADAQTLPRRLVSMQGVLEHIFSDTSGDNVYWFERRPRGTFLYSTPIRVADLLRRSLFDRLDSVVLTSATMTTGDGFQYLRDRLGIDYAKEAVVPGEFDFSTQAMLCIPSDLPEPRDPAYQQASLNAIERLLEITDGYAFLLFTSVRQMERVYEALRAADRYPLLLQGSAPRHRLLERFRRTPRSVLCATSSFWQGVDVRGDALRSVVIDKLPFQVPTEPVVAARLQSLAGDGLDPFQCYSLPAAVITLRQGLGRLIRSRRDRGILTILDSRLWRRRYGRVFLESLPNWQVTDKIEELRNFYDSTGSDSAASLPTAP